MELDTRLNALPVSKLTVAENDLYLLGRVNGNWSLIPANSQVDCDVFVNGATMGGVCAAIAAKQAGYSVVLIEENPFHVGGMSTGGLQFADTPTSSTGLGPLCLDFYTRAATYYGITIAAFMATSGATQHCNGEPHVMRAVAEEMLAENNIVVAHGLNVEQVIKVGLYIQSVRLTNGAVVSAKRYIDATYTSDLMLRAGCSYTVGREANATYTETNNGAGALANLVGATAIDPYVVVGDPTSGLLPNVQAVITAVGAADNRVVGYNYRLCMTRAADKITPPDPPTYNPLDYEYLGRLFAAGAVTGLSSIFTAQALQNGKFDWNTNGIIGTNLYGETYVYPVADYASRAQFATRLKHYTLGLFKFIREDSRIDATTKAAVALYGFPADEFIEDNGFPPTVYVREAARMVGDFVLKETDTENAALVDMVAYAAYNLDSHFVSLVNSADVLKKEGATNVAIGHYYTVPYRAMLPKVTECKNLLNTFGISASHIFFSGARMEYVHMALGESAGYAAALSIAQQKDLPDLHASYIQDAVGLNPVGVIMDVLAPAQNGVVATVGAWTTVTNQDGKMVHGNNYVHDNNAGKGTKSQKFTPVLPAGGSYTISVKFKAVNDASRATNVPFTVQRSGGLSTGTFSQRVPGALTNGFLSLGNFTLVGDGSDYLLIETTGTAGGTYVCVDAVCFTPRFDVL